jgi:hypothetical protein
LVLVVIDHFGSAAGAGTGVEAPVFDVVAAGVNPTDRDDTTGREETSEDTLAAEPGPPEGPDTTDLLDEASDEPDDPGDETPPPRLPESAYATEAGATAVPIAAANTPPTTHRCIRASRRRCCSAASMSF